jgi:peroxiredoxin
MLKNITTHSKFSRVECIYSFLVHFKTIFVYSAFLTAFSFSFALGQEIGAPPEPVKKIIDEAKQLKAAGKIDEALAVLNSGMENYPGSLHLDAEIYHLLVGAKRYEECLRFIDVTLPTIPEPFRKDILTGKRGVLLNLFWQALEEKRDNEKALYYLKELAENGYRGTHQFLNHEHCKPLQRMKEFSDFINRMQENAGIGKPPKDFTVTLTSGDTFTLSEQTGKVVLVDFWGTICAPCIKEFPNMRQLYKKYHDQGFEIISINLDESCEKFESFLEKQPLPWKHIFSGKAWQDELIALYEVESIPFLFLVDKKGVMRYFDVRGEQLAEAVRLLVQE